MGEHAFHQGGKGHEHKHKPWESCCPKQDCYLSPSPLFPLPIPSPRSLRPCEPLSLDVEFPYIPYKAPRLLPWGQTKKAVGREPNPPTIEWCVIEMAQRTVALWKGQFIGIESIYTVINGKQVNIPDKLKELRQKSQHNELFCPCGCGSNLILVAGDRMLREQHFRLKDGEGNDRCHYIQEGYVSVNSKIVLKCWLDENLQAGDLEARVPICDLEDSKRRYEFTFLSREKKFALSYCHERVNRNEEKLMLLQQNSSGIHVLYVDDIENLEAQGQYPEYLMKVQDLQGYLLLLTLGEEKESDYYAANLKAVWYMQDLDGLWKPILLADGPLADFHLGEAGELLFQEKPIEEKLEKAKKWLEKKKAEEEEKRRAEEERRRAREEELKKAQEEARKAAEERRKAEEERRKQELIRLKEREEARRLEEERRREEARKRQEEARKRREAEEKERLRLESLSMEEECNQNDHQARDAWGNRWVKCEYCGKVAKESEFRSYGGPGRINLGVCRDCALTHPVTPVTVHNPTPKTIDPGTCPLCGKPLRERHGPYGPFIGCSGYPQCHYIQRRRRS